MWPQLDPVRNARGATSAHCQHYSVLLAELRHSSWRSAEAAEFGVNQQIWGTWVLPTVSTPRSNAYSQRTTVSLICLKLLSFRPMEM